MIPAAIESIPLLDRKELEVLQKQIIEFNQHRQLAIATPHIGTQRSLFRGQGMELHDVRPYQAGDDIRHMDWRATARSGKATTKVFIEERGRSLLLIIDRRSNMCFGTRKEIKAATAARCAAILAFSAVAIREPVAGILLEDDIHYTPPAKTLGALSHLLQAASAPLAPASGNQTVAQLDNPELLERIERTAAHGTCITFISDFYDVSDKHQALLHQLRSHYEIRAIQIVDQAEETLQDVGPLRLISPGTGKVTVIQSSDKNLRQRYAETMKQKQREIRRLFSKQNIPLTKLYTHKDAFEQLTAY